MNRILFSLLPCVAFLLTCGPLDRVDAAQTPEHPDDLAPRWNEKNSTATSVVNTTTDIEYDEDIRKMVPSKNNSDHETTGVATIQKIEKNTTKEIIDFDDESNTTETSDYESTTLATKTDAVEVTGTTVVSVEETGTHGTGTPSVTGTGTAEPGKPSPVPTKQKERNGAETVIARSVQSLIVVSAFFYSFVL